MFSRKVVKLPDSEAMLVDQGDFGVYLARVNLADVSKLDLNMVRAPLDRLFKLHCALGNMHRKNMIKIGSTLKDTDNIAVNVYTDASYTCAAISSFCPVVGLVLV